MSVYNDGTRHASIFYSKPVTQWGDNDLARAGAHHSKFTLITNHLTEKCVQLKSQKRATSRTRTWLALLTDWQHHGGFYNVLMFIKSPQVHNKSYAETTPRCLIFARQESLLTLNEPLLVVCSQLWGYHCRLWDHLWRWYRHNMYTSLEDLDPNS